MEEVNPTIGNIGILLVPTRPAVYLPNSMIRVYPMGADATDDQIASFPLTISSHRQQELFSIWFADAWFKGVRDFDLAKGYEGLRK